MDSMPMGPLVVMTRDGMSIRVSSSETNVIAIGVSGSGTSWQPSSGPLHVHHWTKGDWLLMFHYHLIAEVNRQGGLRGVTKFDSANWFMAMAYHKLSKGTLQLRSLFSAEPVYYSVRRFATTFPNGRDVQRSTTDRSSASARSIYGAFSTVHVADWRTRNMVHLLRISGRAGAWTSVGSPSNVGFGESFSHACASLAGFDAHQFWRDDDSLYLSVVQSGRIDL